MKRLFWLDMEMTGLDVSKEVIIEVAAVVTDLDFSTLHEYHAVVRQPQQYLDRMDDWNREHHGASGLTQAVPNGRDPGDVENDLISICETHFPGEKPILAGNSISQDRLFIDAHMKRFAAKLHYRMLDVTSWKILMNEKFGVVHKKQNAHRALGDIQESIAELKVYLSFVKVP